MEDFSRKKTCTRLGQIRVERGLSQDAVAAALDVSRETYTQIEGGKRKLKDFEIVQLANLFGVTTDFILRGVASENVAISDEIGLQDESINYLKEVNAGRNIPMKQYLEGGFKYSRIYETLNAILSQGGDCFLEHLSDYLFADFSHMYPIDDDGSVIADVPAETIGIGAGHAIVELSLDAIRFGMLREIEQDLEKLRSSLAQDGLTKRTC